MNNARDALEVLLATLGESSQFATLGSVTPVLPGLEIKGAGSIGFPLSAAVSLVTKATLRRNDRAKDRRVWQSSIPVRDRNAESLPPSPDRRQHFHHRSTNTSAIAHTSQNARGRRKRSFAPKHRTRTSGGSNNMRSTRSCWPNWK